MHAKSFATLCSELTVPSATQNCMFVSINRSCHDSSWNRKPRYSMLRALMLPRYRLVVLHHITPAGGNRRGLGRLSSRPSGRVQCSVRSCFRGSLRTFRRIRLPHGTHRPWLDAS